MSKSTHKSLGKLENDCYPVSLKACSLLGTWFLLLKHRLAHTAGSVFARRPSRSSSGRATYFAFDFICIQQVNEDFKATYVPDGQLARLLHQIKVHHGAQSEHSGRLVASLK